MSRHSSATWLLRTRSTRLKYRSGLTRLLIRTKIFQTGASSFLEESTTACFVVRLYRYQLTDEPEQLSSCTNSPILVLVFSCCNRRYHISSSDIFKGLANHSGSNLYWTQRTVSVVIGLERHCGHWIVLHPIPGLSGDSIPSRHPQSYVRHQAWLADPLQLGQLALCRRPYIRSRRRPVQRTYLWHCDPQERIQWVLHECRGFLERARRPWWTVGMHYFFFLFSNICIGWRYELY